MLREEPMAEASLTPAERARKIHSEEAIPPTNADKTPTPASALSGPKIH